MLRITVELISAITGRTIKLGTMFITNDGTGTAERGDYDVKVMRKGHHDYPRVPNRGVTRWGRVEDYPRKAHNVWRLVLRALGAAFPEERKSGTTKLTPEVMEGLHRIAALSGGRGEDYTAPAMAAALDWLNAGNAEMLDEEQPQEINTSMPVRVDGTADREELQRSVFRGLKLIVHALASDDVSEKQTTPRDEADIAHALRFVQALPE